MNEFWRELLDTVGYSDYIATFADPARKVIFIDTYSYIVDGNTLSADITATAPQSFNIIMDTDSDFVCTYFAGFGRATGSTLMMVNPAMLVQISDRASGKTFFNQAAPMPMICGQGGFPFLLTSPRVVKPRTTLTLTARSAQAQSFTGFYFAMHGGRIFYA
jgi:hypothetical protein